MYHRPQNPSVAKAVLGALTMIPLSDAAFSQTRFDNGRSEAVAPAEATLDLPLRINAPTESGVFDSRAQNLDALMSVCESPSQARKAVSEYLSRPDVVQNLANEIRADISALLKYPREILYNPEVRHASRERINFMLAYRVRYSGSSESLKNLLDKHVELLPDLSALVRATADTTSCDELLQRIVLVNPRANQDLAPLMQTVPPGYAESMLKSLKALEILNIHGVGRFHNARELIINRYHAGTPDERKQIDALLGIEPAFTSGNSSLHSNPVEDTRPLCVVTLCKPDVDPGRAFDANERADGRDDIDTLTSYYKVVYLEPVGARAAIDQMIRVSKTLGRPIELWFCGGHGSPAGVELSSKEAAPAVGQEELSRGHRIELERLRGVFSPDAKVALLSCSTGRADESGPGFAQVLHEALPDVTVYAPDNNTSGYLAFHPDGRFEAIRFDGASRVAFYPNAKGGVIEEGPDRYRGWVRYMGRFIPEHPVFGGVMLGGIIILTKAVYDSCLLAIRRVRRRFQHNVVSEDSV